MLGSGVATRGTGQDVPFCGLGRSWVAGRGLELLLKEGGTMVWEEGRGGTGDPGGGLVFMRQCQQDLVPHQAGQGDPERIAR